MKSFLLSVLAGSSVFTWLLARTGGLDGLTVVVGSVLGPELGAGLWAILMAVRLLVALLKRLQS